jgi:tetratricopeptide (TPR) repeat protein
MSIPLFVYSKRHVTSFELVNDFFFFFFFFFIISGSIFNDLGLLFTQLQKYDKAKKCFEEALPLAQSSGEKKKEAVIRQNLGAAYNFIGEYQRAISFHKSAADMYGK